MSAAATLAPVPGPVGDAGAVRLRGAAGGPGSGISGRRRRRVAGTVSASVDAPAITGVEWTLARRGGARVVRVFSVRD
jgi:hypothetical protein